MGVFVGKRVDWRDDGIGIWPILISLRRRDWLPAVLAVCGHVRFTAYYLSHPPLPFRYCLLADATSVLTLALS